mgnify:CR=1 FL=1
MDGINHELHEQRTFVLRILWKIVRIVVIVISTLLNLILLTGIGLMTYGLLRPCGHHDEYRYLVGYTQELLRNSTVYLDTTSAFMADYLLIADDSTGINSYYFDINKKIKIPDRTSDNGFLVRTDEKGRIRYVGWYEPL